MAARTFYSVLPCKGIEPFDLTGLQKERALGSLTVLALSSHADPDLLQLTQKCCAMVCFLWGPVVHALEMGGQDVLGTMVLYSLDEASPNLAIQGQKPQPQLQNIMKSKLL